jgi:hypothetical protein
MSRRIKLGLTDYERREKDTQRRVRNCFIVLATLIIAMAVFSSV